MRRSSRILFRNSCTSSHTRERWVRTNKKTRQTPFKNKSSRRKNSSAPNDAKQADCKRRRAKIKTRKERTCARNRKSQPKTIEEIELSLEKPAQQSDIRNEEIGTEDGIDKEDSSSEIETPKATCEEKDDNFAENESVVKNFGAKSNKLDRTLKNLSPKKFLLNNDGKTTRSGRQFSPYDFNSSHIFNLCSANSKNDNFQCGDDLVSKNLETRSTEVSKGKRKRGKNIDNWPSLKRKLREKRCEPDSESDDFRPAENKENPTVNRDLFADEDAAFLIGEPPTFSRPEGHNLPADFFTSNVTCSTDFQTDSCAIDDTFNIDVYSYKPPIPAKEKNDSTSDTYPNLSGIRTFSIKRFVDSSQLKALSKISLYDTDVYKFESVFKDAHAQIAHFENKTGHIIPGLGDGRKFDIMESEKEEGKRLYRKKITDSNLIAWHEYNVASSAKYTSDDSTPYVRPVIRLPWMICARADLIWRLNNTRPLPTVDEFFRGLTNCRKRKI